MREGVIRRNLTHLEALRIPLELLDRFVISSRVFEFSAKPKTQGYIFVSLSQERCMGWEIPEDSIRWLTDNDLVYQTKDNIL